MKKNILALQLHSKIADFEVNCAKISNWLEFFYLNFNCICSARNIASEKPDILFLPELWTVGWDCEAFSGAVDENKKTFEFLAKIAKKYKLNIIGGSFLRKTDNGVKNSCPVLNRNGLLFDYYDKIHLYSPDGEAKTVSPGTGPVVVDIDGLLIGLSICYDIRFPELFRSYANLQTPPHLLVNLSAWPKSRRVQYEAMAKSRAVENQAYFLALSQTGLIKDGVFNNGFSSLTAPLGETVAVLDENEGFIFETIDTEIVDNVRKTFPNLENRKVHNFGFTPRITKVRN